MSQDEEIKRLKERVVALETANSQLTKELKFLTTYPTLAQGNKGEVLVAGLTGGVRTGYAAPHDIVVENGSRIEVKFSRGYEQGRTSTKRWG